MTAPSLIRDQLRRMGELSMLHKRARNECLNQMQSISAPFVLSQSTYFILVAGVFMYVFWSLLTRSQNVNTENGDSVGEVKKSHIGTKMALFTALTVCLIMNKRPVSASNYLSRLHPVPLFFGFFGMVCGTIMLGLIFMESFAKTYEMKMNNPQDNIKLNNMQTLYNNANQNDVQDAMIFFGMCVAGVFIGVENKK